MVLLSKSELKEIFSEAADYVHMYVNMHEELKQTVGGEQNERFQTLD